MNPAVIEARRNNTKNIFLAIMKNCGTSRLELAEEFRLSAATVTLAVNDLLALDLVSEVSGFSPVMGRKTKLLILNEKRNNILYIQIVPENTIRLRLCDLGGHVRQARDVTAELVVKGRNAAAVVGSITAAITSFIQECREPPEKLLAVTLIVPGLIYQDGTIEVSHFNWRQFPLTGAIHSCLNVPVFAETFLRINGWYESLFITEKRRSIVYLMLEPGVGLSYFQDGRPLLGKNNSFGEIGHISLNPGGPRCYCGNYGCVEEYCENGKVLRRFQNLLDEGACPILSRLADDNGGVLNYDIIFKAYRRGSVVVQELLAEVAEYLGMTFLTIRNILDPDYVIISGQLVAKDSFVLQSALQYMRERTLLSGMREPEFKLAKISNENMEVSTCAYTVEKMLQYLS